MKDLEKRVEKLEEEMRAITAGLKAQRICNTFTLEEINEFAKESHIGPEPKPEEKDVEEVTGEKGE